MKIFTTVSEDGHVMTYGLWDRLITWLIHRLDWYHEKRTEKMWYKANNPLNPHPRKRW